MRLQIDSHGVSAPGSAVTFLDHVFLPAHVTALYGYHRVKRLHACDTGFDGHVSYRYHIRDYTIHFSEDKDSKFL